MASKPTVISYEDKAIDFVVNILNRAKTKAGARLNLLELAESRNEFLSRAKVSLNSLGSPLVKTCEKLIKESIERKWRLTDAFMYTLRYMKSSVDETAHFLYYEAVFSQPTADYPVPQATVSVFFKVKDKHLGPADTPQMTFRIEGHEVDHDVRDVLLTTDWILAVLQMKLKFFKRIEALRFF